MLCIGTRILSPCRPAAAPVVLSVLLVGPILALLAAESRAQTRVQFPTPDPHGAPLGSGSRIGLPPATNYRTPPATNYRQPPVSIFTQGPLAPSTTAPPASLQGGIAPANTWDPYGTSAPPVSTAPFAPAPARDTLFPAQPSALFPGNGQQILPQVGTIFSPGGYAQPAPASLLNGGQRLFQELRYEATWLTDDDFGMTTFEIAGTLAFPFLYNQAPLLITPGFAINYTTGPVTSAATGFADVPPRLYDVYLDAGWEPALTPWLKADLGLRVGIYSDFDNVSSDSFRIMGRGLAVLSYTPTTQVVAGVVYLDRLRVKLLPAGGVICTPNQDTKLEFYFPRPKFAHRWRTVGTTDLWYYIAGEYGGGSWAIDRIAGEDVMDYNDYRAIAGLEWRAVSGKRGTFEIAYVFGREILYDNLPPNKYQPDDTLMLRAGCAY